MGVGTEDPRSTFQVGNNADAGEKGVGISSVGNINMTGILTATSLIGNLTGDVTGRITGDLVGTEIQVLWLSRLRDEKKFPNTGKLQKNITI